MKRTAYMFLVLVPVVAAAVLFPQCSAHKGNHVILIVSDALRKDMPGCYGGAANTPHMDWLAANGVLFERAYATSPWTTPSAVSMLTGNYPTSYESKPIPVMKWDIPLVLHDETLPAELLSRAGFDVKMDVENISVIGQYTTQGFEKIKTYDELTASERISVERITSIEAGHDSYRQMYGFLNYLLTKPGGRFFALKWILDPHSPYNPPDPFRQAMQIDPSQLPKQESFYSDLLFIGGNYSRIEGLYLKELYTKEVESVDQRLGYILKALEEANLFDDTYIVFTSDHGELFGEHGEWCHGQNLYEELVSVPLIIAGPGISRGKRVSAIVSLVGIMETVRDLLGVAFEQKSQGESFKHLLAGNPLRRLLFTMTHDSAAYLDYAERRSNHQDALRDNGYKLICCKDGSYELYNLADDPREMNNVWKKHPDVVTKMRGRIHELRAGNTVMREGRTKTEESQPINEELIGNLKALGYIE